MAVSPVSANAAYQAIQRMGTGAANAGAGDIAGSFGSFLKEAVGDAVGTMRAGEIAAAEGAAGKADIVQVVNAVTAAELTLETVVAIRDRVINAYQDILKMPI